MNVKKGTKHEGSEYAVFKRHATPEEVERYDSLLREVYDLWRQAKDKQTERRRLLRTVYYRGRSREKRGTKPDAQIIK